MSSDAGGSLLMRQAESGFGLLAALAYCPLHDPDRAGMRQKRQVDLVSKTTARCRGRAGTTATSRDVNIFIDEFSFYSASEYLSAVA